MLNTILENLVTVLKSGETQKFAMESIENIAKLCLTGDIESGVHEIIGGIQYASSIKDILFWSKMKKWLENTYSSPDMEDKISSKFTEDEPKYKEYTMRQIQYIAQVDEEEKICYYANLTRAWLIGSIDTSIYFKLAYLLRVFTLEELEYLKNDYKKEEFEKIDFYIREFSLYGLVDVVHISN
ncbi:MAG: hypothetical protein K2O65_17785, partial [Lachnospiraceae bacterium]|nr:hypothetical protein [Lachnospiraceae bacterium]